MDDRARELNARIEDLRSGCHATYNGGHHDEPAYSAFHHGMDTICNVLAGGWLSAYGDEVRGEALERAARIVDDVKYVGDVLLMATKIRSLIKESK